MGAIFWKLTPSCFIALKPRLAKKQAPSITCEWDGAITGQWGKQPVAQSVKRGFIQKAVVNVGAAAKFAELYARKIRMLSPRMRRLNLAVGF
jgi:hypothetical protein